MAIAVVGAGVAGLATSIFLKRSGLEVHVFERASTLEAVGSGIMLQPSGMAVLHELGLLDQCLRKGAPLKGVLGTSKLGERLILDTRYEHWKRGAHGLGIHRSVLLEVLYEEAKRCGVKFFFGVNVSDFVSAEVIEITVTERNPSPASQSVLDSIVATRQISSEYDALILASGRNSTLQYKSSIQHRAKPYTWGALWATVELPDRLNESVLRQWYKQSRQMFGIMPIGEAANNTQRLCSLFWSRPVEYGHGLFGSSGSLDGWKRDVRALVGIHANPLLEQLQSEDQFSLATYTDIEMPGWHCGRVLAIGDCAHSMSPQLGQGANMGLVDAMTIAEVIIEREIAEEPQVLHWPAIFAQYSKYRRKHLGYYQSASRHLTPLFQSASSITPLIRDAALLAAQHVGFVRNHAVTTLIGGRTGWLASTGPKVPLHYWDGTAP
ncbi:FAD-dependent oxidoreductase [Pseudomonas serbica]|uniref:FAD-dependent oxidoreductase n=1 Tax=Pseudomonas serbica TaxID=2965074 RepID=UPI00237B1766|nr:NAD(P)/FAD-dependent oxidoreductase [Pseudomonas serbica]